MKFLKSKITKTIGFILDEFFPPIIRDSRLFYVPIIKVWNRKIQINFKRKAFYLTNDEFQQAYEDLAPMRSTDNTPKTIDFVLNNISGKTVLEVGCGNGDLSIACARKEYQVTATDIAKSNLSMLKNKIANSKIIIKTKLANVENLPYENNSFDTTICLHTLEHVRNIYLAIEELKRVTKKRLVIIVPKQRFHKYTPDYHLNFFGEPMQLVNAIGLRNYKCSTIDFCLCYYGDF